jgi:hypothetical protein
MELRSECGTIAELPSAKLAAGKAFLGNSISLPKDGIKTTVIQSPHPLQHANMIASVQVRSSKIFLLGVQDAKAFVPFQEHF